MYTLSGSYGEVVAFLEGYFSGLAIGPSRLKRTDPWAAFASHLAATYKNHHDVFQAFFNEHGPESLAELSKAYLEFSSGQVFD